MLLRQNTLREERQRSMRSKSSSQHPVRECEYRASSPFTTRYCAKHPPRGTTNDPHTRTRDRSQNPLACLSERSPSVQVHISSHFEERRCGLIIDFPITGDKLGAERAVVFMTYSHISTARVLTRAKIKIEGKGARARAQLS